MGADLNSHELSNSCECCRKEADKKKKSASHVQKQMKPQMTQFQAIKTEMKNAVIKAADECNKDPDEINKPQMIQIQEIPHEMKNDVNKAADECKK